MRLIMLDTETTGLLPERGDRMVEIAAIKMVDRSLQQGSDCKFHRFINPGRHIPSEVVRVHGIDNVRVNGEPIFSEIAQDFLDFIDGATLVIHNARFDLGFLNHELGIHGFDTIEHIPVIDTLALARKKHPGKSNTLDALCDRYGINRDRRSLHGALIDAELLAEVYLCLTAAASQA